MREKVHTCPCGCGKKYPALPPGTWLTSISGWHRVRITNCAGPEYSSDEIGCGNDPADAAEEAWKVFEKWARLSLNGKCWYW